MDDQTEMSAEAHHQNISRDTNSPGAVHDAVQAVGDSEDRAVWKLLVDGSLNQVVSLKVNSRCGLIQD